MKPENITFITVYIFRLMRQLLLRFISKELSLVRELKHGYSISRQWISERIRLSITFLLFGTITYRALFAASAKPFLVTVEDQTVGFPLRHTDTEIVSVYRCKIADKQQAVFPVFALSYKAENTPLCVICIDPFKPIPAVI